MKKSTPVAKEAEGDEQATMLQIFGGGVLGWLIFYVLLGPEQAYHAIAGLAILVGGGWTLYQFVLRRSGESALSIDYDVTTEPAGQAFMVFFEVTFANGGNRKLTASDASSTDLLGQYEQSIEYPGDLQIKTLPSGGSPPVFFDWWTNAGGMTDIPGLPGHIPLLNDFSEPEAGVDFFMEPGERYQLGSTFLLPRGHYLAKVVFVGSRETEYWSRIVYFTVPTEPKSKPQASGASSSGLGPHGSAGAEYVDEAE